MINGQTQRTVSGIAIVLAIILVGTPAAAYRKFLSGQPLIENPKGSDS